MFKFVHLISSLIRCFLSRYYLDDKTFTVLRFVRPSINRWVEISSPNLLGVPTLLSNSAMLNLESFKVYSLFSYQGSKFNLRLNSSVDRAFLFSATAYTVYRLSSHLSTTFFIFLLVFCFYLTSSLIMISHTALFVNTFFFSKNTFCASDNTIRQAEKEGFEPSRRY